jgi:hypothetical protein
MGKKSNGSSVSSMDTTPPSTTWRYFIYRPHAGWWLIPAGKLHSVYRGVQALPEFAGKTARIAIAKVIWHRGKIRKFVGMEADTWTFDGDGFVDRHLIVLGIAAKMRRPVPVDPETVKSPFTDKEMVAFRASLGLKEDDS